MDNHIKLLLHCAACLRSIPDGISPRDYAAVEVGLTEDGSAMQVWCRRHERHIAIFSLAEPVEAHCDKCGGPHEAAQH